MKLETRLTGIKIEIKERNCVAMEKTLRDYVIPSLESLYSVRRIIGVNAMNEEMKQAINTLEDLKYKIIEIVYTDENIDYVVECISKHKGKTLGADEQEELLTFIREQMNRKYPDYNWKACGLSGWLYYLEVDHYYTRNKKTLCSELHLESEPLPILPIRDRSGLPF